MVLTFRDLKKIQLPVFSLPHSDWYKADGLLFMDGRILDDKNMPGKSLGVRRMQTPFRDRLHPIRSSINSLVGLIKQKGFNCYIDSNGVPFIYAKTTKSLLKYYKIRRVDLKDTESILWAEGVKIPFKIPRPPPPEMEYVSILHFGGLPWILYEYSESYKKDTWRKV